MAKRTKRSKTIHNEKVRQIAERLEKQDWNVKADLRGYNKPEPIGKDGKIPDVEARKRGATRLVEVETPETLEAHKEQQATFRRSAAHKTRTTFKVVVAKRK